MARILDFSHLDSWVYLYAAIPPILGLYLSVVEFTGRPTDDDADAPQ
ncbi:MAG TPA: hypothetical protein VNX86_06220 [Rhizomicrobium sp.]|nr:hypothetical protein [Rhizomicrobium sp.]